MGRHLVGRRGYFMQQRNEGLVFSDFDSKWIYSRGSNLLCMPAPALCKCAPYLKLAIATYPGEISKDNRCENVKGLPARILSLPTFLRSDRFQSLRSFGVHLMRNPSGVDGFVRWRRAVESDWLYALCQLLLQIRFIPGTFEVVVSRKLEFRFIKIIIGQPQASWAVSVPPREEEMSGIRF